MNYYELIEPVNRRVSEIYDHTFERNITEIGGEVIETGSFERSYTLFRTDRLRAGKNGSKEAFYSSLLTELEQIEISVIELEKELKKEGKTVTFHAIFSEIQRTRRRLEKLKANESGNNREKPKSKIYTYQWIEEPIFKEKFRKLITGELIEPPKNAKHFEEVFFRGVEITEGFTPLVWRSGNASELKYFIEQIIALGFVMAQTKGKWNQLSACIVGADGSPLSKKFGNLNVKNDSNLGTNTKNRIDALLGKVRK